MCENVQAYSFPKLLDISIYKAVFTVTIRLLLTIVIKHLLQQIYT